MSYLGIDIGTTGCKAVVFDGDGSILAARYCEYGVVSAGVGWFELDCAAVMAACREVIAGAAGEVRGKDAVSAIGISSQGEAFTLLDDRDRYLCGAMVSFDTRSQAEVAEFTERFGAERLYNITGHSSHTLFSLFKVLWFKKHRPGEFKQIKKLLCMGDLLGYELTGEAVISHNLAARTMMFDVVRREWSREILEAIGLDEKVLSRAAGAGEVVGKVRAGIASELGLGADVIVATGGHDQSCGALGVGAMSAAVAAYSIGTVECITPAFEGCVLNEAMRKSNLASYPHVVSDLYTTVAFCMTGGSGVRWLRDTFGKWELEQAAKTGENVYDLLLRDMPDGPSDMLVLPHFTSTGTPYFDAKPTGAILGVKLSTSRGEFTKAILEGISFEMKLNLEVLRKAEIVVRELRAFGGGTNSAAWMQIKADILNVPIVCLSVTEAGCMGAAMLAAKACGDKSLEECKGWVKSGREYEPGAERVAVYGERFEKYGRMYETIKSLGEF